MSPEIIEFLKISLLVMGNILCVAILVSAVVIIKLLQQIYVKVEKTKLLAESTFYNLADSGSNFVSLAQSLFGNRKTIKDIISKFFR